MISIIRAIARLCVAVAAVAAFLPIAPTYAQNIAFVSPGGSGTSCTVAAPCPTILAALQRFLPPLRIICLDGATADTSNISLNDSVSNGSFDIDCPLGFEAGLTIPSGDSNVTMRIRHLDFGIVGITSPIVFDGSGTLVLEDCVFTDATGVALDIEPNGPLNVVIRSSRISNNAAGVLSSRARAAASRRPSIMSRSPVTAAAASRQMRPTGWSTWTSPTARSATMRATALNAVSV